MRNIVTIMLVAAALAPAAAAARDTGYEVRYADLDLATESGRAALDQRIGDAADSLCREFAPSTPMPALGRARCTKMVVSVVAEQRDAVVARAGVDRPKLALGRPQG